MKQCFPLALVKCNRRCHVPITTHLDVTVLFAWKSLWAIKIDWRHCSPECLKRPALLNESALNTLHIAYLQIYIILFHISAMWVRLFTHKIQYWLLQWLWIKLKAQSDLKKLTQKRLGWTIHTQDTFTITLRWVFVCVIHQWMVFGTATCSLRQTLSDHLCYTHKKLIS